MIKYEYSKLVDSLRTISVVRRSGYTTWILDAAILNPNCIIVAHNFRYAEELRFLYLKKLNKFTQDKFAKLPWYIKLFNKKPKEIFNVQYPKFKSLTENLIGYNCPIIYDNSCFMPQH